MTFSNINRRTLNTVSAMIYAVVFLSALLGMQTQKVSAESITLPPPASPGDSCVWMGELHYEQTVKSTYVSPGYNRNYDYELKQDAVSAPVEGETCGALWSGDSKLTMAEYQPAYCTVDPLDINTKKSIQTANFSGTGRYTASLVSSGTYLGQYFLNAYQQPLTKGSLVDNFSNDRCGGSGTQSYEYAFSSIFTSICVTSPTQVQFQKIGFFLTTNSQASVGSCTRTVGSTEDAGTFQQYDKMSWRMKKVNCITSVDSDGGGTGDCQEYEDNTNPMDLTDDIQTDKTAPTIVLNTPLSGGTVTLGAIVAASYACQDEVDGSGIASCTGSVNSGDSLNTATVGSKSFTITATDNAGNVTSVTASYTVTYQNSGFLGPVDSNIVNKAKAGQTVPVQFRLVDANGTPISSSSSFVSLTAAGTTCSASEAVDAIEQYTSGSSGLQYLGDGYWQYNWKTAKTYAGQCYMIYLNLADGTKASAKFQF